jgi:hypothetical protein
MSPDNEPEVWPPPPDNEYQTQIEDISCKPDIWRFCLSCAGRKLTIEANYKSHFVLWNLDWLDWVRPLGCGVAGAAVGAIVLLSGTLLLLFYGNPEKWTIDFKLTLFLAAVTGLVVGFICGVGCWLVGRSLLRRRSNRHTHHSSQEP